MVNLTAMIFNLLNVGRLLRYPKRNLDAVTMASPTFWSICRELESGILAEKNKRKERREKRNTAKAPNFTYKVTDSTANYKP